MYTHAYPRVGLHIHRHAHTSHAYTYMFICYTCTNTHTCAHTHTGNDKRHRAMDVVKQVRLVSVVSVEKGAWRRKAVFPG